MTLLTSFNDSLKQFYFFMNISYCKVALVEMILGFWYITTIDIYMKILDDILIFFLIIPQEMKTT